MEKFFLNIDYPIPAVELILIKTKIPTITELNKTSVLGKEIGLFLLVDITRTHIIILKPNYNLTKDERPTHIPILIPSIVYNMEIETLADFTYFLN